MGQQALLLDRNYMALSVITWKRALSLIIKGKAEAVGEEVVHSISTNRAAIKVPLVLRLLSTIPWKAFQSRMKFSRKHVVVRDDYECQYCGKHLGKSSATIDHVVPVSRGGGTNYLNCVTSCKDCNNKKGSKTPQEAGMTLKKVPKKPSFMALYKHHTKEPPDAWANYLLGGS